MSLFAPAATFWAIAEVMPKLSYRWARASAGRLSICATACSPMSGVCQACAVSCQT
jgi:hypothetical protein